MRKCCEKHFAYINLVTWVVIFICVCTVCHVIQLLQCTLCMFASASEINGKKEPRLHTFKQCDCMRSKNVFRSETNFITSISAADGIPIKFVIMQSWDFRRCLLKSLKDAYDRKREWDCGVRISRNYSRNCF